MELKPKNYDKIVQLINKGVDVRNPLTLDIGEEVSISRISGNRVTIYPGCRIYGDKTVISEGTRIGYEGPVTIDNCQIGPKVDLKGGYFNKAVFLESANMGLGAHVREGCILEEEANGAHCVGLKQTILFPFVTLGSLINFCDCLMAGGTSRKDHSEVGSSYIHFNYTPDGNKTTASLIGDVSRGVMLNQPAIFLGGQGGIVGPLSLGYGNVVAAGSVLRQDVTGDKNLIIAKTPHGAIRRVTPHTYNSLSRVVGNNIIYLANLIALELWYTHVRREFFSFQEFGELIYEGAIDKLRLAGKERIKRLKVLAENVPQAHKNCSCMSKSDTRRCELHNNIDEVCELFENGPEEIASTEKRDDFLQAFCDYKKDSATGYIKAVQNMPAAVSQQGVSWLQDEVTALSDKAASLLQSLNMFKKKN
jgi:UDP-N-acetylglucosamine/UDP-N-acetylgalactosamine diphosphorylase